MHVVGQRSSAAKQVTRGMAPATPVFAGEPAPTGLALTAGLYARHVIARPARSGVGAGLPAKGPDLLANFHQPFTVAAATVFAGKPAPTLIGGGDTLVIGRRPFFRKQ
ncbi:hypothetical protein A210_08110 [Pseudomonas putida SJTE-1]|nr:hypothetical protein A210_08110 [Pseudomonas putida SJTE-1]POA81372.1 hypothetical protein C1882_25230 [Pseudomonas sp. FW305-E2]PTV55392.1 hypothetical protein DBL05_20675 [Pseudomonas putida]PTV58435.1 hypothetical protein DBL03_18415 [Pseudomonas putida]